MVGVIALFGLVIYMVALAAAVIWSIVTGNFGVGTFILTVLAALPISGIVPKLFFKPAPTKGS